MAEILVSIISLGIALASILIVLWDHIKDDRILTKRVQSFYEYIEGLVYSYYQMTLIREKFSKTGQNKNDEVKWCKYAKINKFYKRKIEQLFEDLSIYLGLTYHNKPEYYFSLDNEYFIKCNGSIHTFHCHPQSTTISPGVCFYHEEKKKYVLDHESIHIIDNFLKNLRDHWNTYYYKKVLRKKLKQKHNFSELLSQA